MSWSLVLGGAACVYDDLNRAIKLFGEPDVVVAVKDIWVEYPRVDHVATYHIDRIPRELQKRRSLGYEDPICVWTYSHFRTPKIGLQVKAIRITGGSSGLLGAMVGKQVADRAVLAGIPLDPTMPHFHTRKYGKPWKEGSMYLKTWHAMKAELQDKVKSMSGYTQKILGEPTLEWINGAGNNDTGKVHDTFLCETSDSETSNQGNP